MGATSHSSEESPTSCDGTQKIQVLALARAIANSSPNPYEKDALKFNVCTNSPSQMSKKVTNFYFFFFLERRCNTCDHHERQWDMERNGQRL